MRSLAMFALVLFGWLAPGLNQMAWAQTATVCYAAATKGADGPIDYGAYCWIDFTPLNLTQAKSGSGQSFRVNLQGGAFLTFTLKITPGNTAGDNMYAVAVPSWTGAAFGNSAFNSIPGKPILYQDENNQNGPQDTVTLSNLTLDANGTTDLPFVFVAADGESSNVGETLSLTTTGDPWALVSAPGESNPNRNMPTLTPPTMVGSSTGSQTVTIDGTAGGVDGEGSYVFTTNNSPGTVTATLQGNGLQGVLFGLKYHTIGLSLTKTHVGDFTAGSTGTYTINAANTVKTPEINPPSEPQPVRVVDTLPVGLTYASASGTGWTCSHVGQVITCDMTSLQYLTTSKAFPPITIGVNVASNAPATLTNNAEVSDPTTSTLVFNVCETAGNGVCPNSAISTTGDPTAILHPDLSTSTKTVVDINGGYAEPGDVLHYTINMVETAGIAGVGLQVTDVLAANLGSLTVSSIPAGATDASVGNTLSITGINLPANGTASIEFTAVISSAAAQGDKVNNTATIKTSGNVTVGTPVAEELTVQIAQNPATGNKYLYLNTSPALKLTRARPAAGADLTINNSTECFSLAPLSKALTLSSATVAISVRMKRGDTGGGKRRVSAQFYLNSTGNALSLPTPELDMGSNTYNNFTNIATNIDLNATSFAASDVLIFCVKNRDKKDVVLSQNDGGVYSFVRLSASTVINVDSVTTYSAAYNATSTKLRYIQGEHAYLRAIVSDPFGSGDLTGATVTIKDAVGASIVTAGPMTSVATTASTRTYEYDYTVPDNPRIGVWTVEVTAKEGEEGEVTHTRTGGFPVEGKLTLGKTWSGGLPGDTAGNAVSLGIAGGSTTTAGTSTAPATTTPAVASAVAAATLTLSESFTSGSAGNYTPSMVCTRAKDSVVIATTGTGLTRTLVMPDDSAVTCVWANNWTVALTVVKLSTVYSDPVNGTTNPKAIPGAVIEYQITIANPAANPIDGNTVFLSDPLPSLTALRVADLGGSGSGPVSLTNGAPTSGLTYTFTSLSSGSDDVAFSDNGGSTWTYSPTPDVDGYDAAVNAIRINPKGLFNPNNAQFTLKYRVRLK